MIFKNCLKYLIRVPSKLHYELLVKRLGILLNKNEPEVGIIASQSVKITDKGGVHRGMMQQKKKW